MNLHKNPQKTKLKIVLFQFLSQILISDKGWLGVAIVLDKLQVPGHPFNLDNYK